MELVDAVRCVLQQKGHQVCSVPPDASVYEAIEIMADKQIGSLLVVSEGNLIGMLSERDYARKVILQGKSSKQTPVEEIMVSPVVFVTPDHTVEESMKIMTSNRVRHLPVIEDGKIVGIVSIGDLVKWVISAQQETISHLHNYINGSYPG